MTNLRVGSATVEITPEWPLTLAGFAVRTHPSEGVAQPLHVRVAVLESEAADGTRDRVLIASADMLWWGPQQVSIIRRQIAEAVGIPERNILLSATHTHSGPQASTRASATVGVADPRFLDLLFERTMEATAAALADLEAVTISRVNSSHALGFNRRYDWNPNGPEDPALTVVRFDRPDGRPKTLFVHYTCHPVITQEYLVSGEFCGVAMDQVEAALGVNALYLQGCCGDINPDVAGERRTARGTNTDVERLGGAFADAILAALGQPGEQLAARPLHVERVEVDLPFGDLPDTDALSAMVATPGVEGEWAQALLAHPEWLTPSIPLQLQRVDIADGLSLLAMDGEVVVDYGLRIRQRSGGTVLPMGYANGMTGYIPTARIIAEGGYEAGGAIPYFFLPAPFTPAVEDVLNDALDRMISSI